MPRPSSTIPLSPFPGWTNRHAPTPRASGRLNETPFPGWPNLRRLTSGLRESFNVRPRFRGGRTDPDDFRKIDPASMGPRFRGGRTRYADKPLGRRVDWDLQRLVDSVFTLPASFAFSRTAGCPCGSGQRRPPASPGPRSRAGRATGCAASRRNCQLCVGFGERDSFLRLRPAGGAARAPRRHGWPVRVPARSQGGSGRSSSSGGAASAGGGGSSHPPSMR